MHRQPIQHHQEGRASRVGSGDTAYETLLFERDEHVAILTFNRPDKLNSLSPTTMREFSQALDAVQADPEIRCLILTGAGDRAFSTGFDLDGLEFPKRTDLAKAH